MGNTGSSGNSGNEIWRTYPGFSRGPDGPGRDWVRQDPSAVGAVVRDLGPLGTDQRLSWMTPLAIVAAVIISLVGIPILLLMAFALEEPRFAAAAAALPVLCTVGAILMVIVVKQRGRTSLTVHENGLVAYNGGSIPEVLHWADVGMIRVDSYYTPSTGRVHYFQVHLRTGETRYVNRLGLPSSGGRQHREVDDVLEQYVRWNQWRGLPYQVIV